MIGYIFPFWTNGAAFWIVHAIRGERRRHTLPHLPGSNPLASLSSQPTWQKPAEESLLCRALAWLPSNAGDDALTLPGKCWSVSVWLAVLIRMQSVSSVGRMKLKMKFSAFWSLFEEVQYTLGEQKFCYMEPVPIVKYPSWKSLKTIVTWHICQLDCREQIRETLATLCKSQNKTRLWNYSVFGWPTALRKETIFLIWFLWIFLCVHLEKLNFGAEI